MSRTLLSAFVAAVLLALPLRAFGENLGDPTRPPTAIRDLQTATDEPPGTPLELQAVFFAEGRRLAIINDRRVGLGDVVLSARVLAIERDRVSLTKDGETIELALVREDVKRRSPIRGDLEDDPDALPAAPADDQPRALPAAPANAVEGTDP